MDLNRKQKIALTVAIVVVAAGVLTGGIYYTWLITPPSPPKTAEEGLKMMGSARFQHMASYRKTAYVEQTQKLMSQLSNEQRRNLFRQMRTDENVRKAMGEAHMAMMTQEAVNFAKASPADRIKMLDAAITREEQMRQAWAGRRPGGPSTQPDQGRPGGRRDQAGPGGSRGPGGPGGPGRGDFRARMQQFVEHGNPQMAGLMREYRRAIHERRAQLGLPDHRPRPNR